MQTLLNIRNDFLNQDNFAVTLLASNAQIEQMRRNYFEEANGDVTFGNSAISAVFSFEGVKA